MHSTALAMTQRVLWPRTCARAARSRVSRAHAPSAARSAGTLSVAPCQLQERTEMAREVRALVAAVRKCAHKNVHLDESGAQLLHLSPTICVRESNSKPRPQRRHAQRRPLLKRIESMKLLENRRELRLQKKGSGSSETDSKRNSVTDSNGSCATSFFQGTIGGGIEVPPAAPARSVSPPVDTS